MDVRKIQLFMISANMYILGKVKKKKSSNISMLGKMKNKKKTPATITVNFDFSSPLFLKGP